MEFSKNNTGRERSSVVPLSAGVVDQRIDETESVEEVEKFTQPLLKFFNPEKILLTSECGFGHVPIDIVRNKIKILVSTAKKL